MSDFAKHWSLIKELTKRDVLGRYRGASFGMLWSLISPFLLLMIYTFSFGTVMGGRWPEVQSGDTHFSIVLFVGIIIHGFFSECFNKSPVAIVENPSYVKRVIFPLEILPWKIAFSALFHMVMNVVVFVVLRLIMDHAFDWTIVFLPIVIFPLFVLTMGVSWFVMSLGVYFRDVSQVTGVVSMGMLFMSSAMVPTNSVPESYRWVFKYNPISFIVDQARNVMLWGKLPDFTGLLIYLGIAIAIFLFGRAWFQATRRGFADVL